MAHAYTPGLKVTARTTHRVRRILPIKGEVAVAVGDRVKGTDVVAETFMPGDIFPVNLANALSLPPGDVVECMLKQEGEAIEVGEPIARTKGIFGMFKNEYKAKYAGVLETVSPVTGQLIIRGDPIPVRVQAYLSGDVVEVLPEEGCVIEADIAMIQGIFGVGGETHGEIVLACEDHAQEVTADLIKPEMKNKVVIGGARMTDAAIRKAKEVGAAALISGGMDDEDLKNFLGYDLGVAITGSERMGLTIVVTEGFGEIAMAERTFKLLASHVGREAAVNGATQIRAGVMRPEILIPLAAEHVDTGEADFEPGLLEIGRLVRVIRDPYFGVIGTVAGLPAAPAVLDSGSKARVLEVKFESGDTAVIPRANIELIEG